MKTDINNYVPFGPEWEKEMMKWNKPALIEFLKKNLTENTRLKEINAELVKALEKSNAFIKHLQGDNIYSQFGLEAIAKAKEAQL